jgi:aryl-alcohol dehydrogenase-like predicted oxidoreductase
MRRGEMADLTAFAAVAENLSFPGGRGRKALMQQCEVSLRCPQTDYIDPYWPHLWDRTAPIEQTLRGLDDFVASGKVRYIGFSDLPAWKVSQAQAAVAHSSAWRRATLCRSITPCWSGSPRVS